MPTYATLRKLGFLKASQRCTCSAWGGGGGASVAHGFGLIKLRQKHVRLVAAKFEAACIRALSASSIRFDWLILFAMTQRLACAKIFGVPLFGLGMVLLCWSAPAFVTPSKLQPLQTSGRTAGTGAERPMEQDSMPATGLACCQVGKNLV